MLPAKPKDFGEIMCNALFNAAAKLGLETSASSIWNIDKWNDTIKEKNKELHTEMWNYLSACERYSLAYYGLQRIGSVNEDDADKLQKRSEQCDQAYEKFDHILTGKY